MAKTLVSSAAFGANFEIMLRKENYFSPDLKMNPLLHMWSLGVEEQYYIIWPLMAKIISSKQDFRRGLLIFIALAIFSFASNVALVFTFPKIAFYSPLTRLWQMLAGSFLAYLAINKKCTSNETRSVVAPVLGISLFTLGLLFLNEDRVFPGFWALLPTCGAAFIIQAGEENYINKYILGNGLMVFIGKISYPLYLWHWPLLVFSRLIFPSGSLSLMADPGFIIFLSFILSLFSYFLVEKNLRYRKTKYLVSTLSIVMMVIFGLGMMIIFDPREFSIRYHNSKTVKFQEDMFPPPNSSTNEIFISSSRLPRFEDPTVAKIHAAIQDWNYPQSILKTITSKSKFLTSRGGTVLNDGQNTTIMIIGDSYTEMLAGRFIKLYEMSLVKGKAFPTIVFMAKGGKPFLPCEDDYYQILDIINDIRPKNVLISHDWLGYIRPGGSSDDGLHNIQKCCHDREDECKQQSPQDALHLIESFKEALMKLADLNIGIYVATIHPQGPKFNPSLMTSPAGIIDSAIQPISLSEFRQDVEHISNSVEKAIKDGNGKIIDFSKTSV